jgi:hypothetical protein
MEVESTLVRSDFPRSVTIALKMPDGFSGEQTYTLTEAGNGSTRVAVDARYKFAQAVSRLLEPVISASARKKLEGDLQRLRTILANKSASSTPQTAPVR